MKRSLLYKVFAAMLLTAFLVQTFSKPFIVADYYVNTSSYARNCVNKIIPMMHCNGKCQMMKKLQEQEKKEQESSERKGENKAEVLSTKTFFASAILVETFFTKRQYSSLIIPAVTDRAAAIFHPPGHISFAS